MTTGSEKSWNKGAVRKSVNWLIMLNPAARMGPPTLEEKKHKADYGIPAVPVFGGHGESNRPCD